MRNTVVLICDENYAFPTMVSIQSIINHYKKSKELDIKVCTCSMGMNYISKFRSLSSELIKVDVNIFSSEDFNKKIEQIEQKSHVTKTALIKFELAQYFKDLEKVLYLDSDVVVKKDISELFDIDIEGRYVAASYEFWNYFNKIRYFFPWNRNSDGFYFNSGVMLLNLKEFRNNAIPQKLWEYKMNKASKPLMDQECLNAICKDKAIPLSIKWNFNPVFYKEILVKNINTVYFTNYTSLNNLLNDVAIIHYVGKKDKPWMYETARMKELWLDEYYSLPFTEKLNLERESEMNSKPLKESIEEKYKINGIEGLLSYAIYSIKDKIKSLKY